MQNPWISNSPFRSDSGCGSSPADQFIQSDAGRAGKSDRNETHKQTNLYIILEARQEDLTQIKQTSKQMCILFFESQAGKSDRNQTQN